MIRLSKILLYFTAAFLLAWLLPWFYNFLTTRPNNTPFTLYSCITQNFASIEVHQGNVIRRDESGKTYTDKEFDSILPLFYYRQLMVDGRNPDTLYGKALTPQSVSMQSFIFRHNPSDINKVKPKLYPLLESMSGRVDLEMPDDVFRIDNHIEFIDMATNRVNESKSERFTRSLIDKGFQFPARYVQGNPTVQKEYDEGYMLIDSKGELFHLKQVKGRPHIKHIDLPDSIQPADLFVTEFSDRRSYAFLSDARHQFYVITKPEYALRRLPVDSFDPHSETMLIIADPLNWTVNISSDVTDRYYALDAESHKLVDTLSYPIAEKLGSKIGRWIFPFELTFTSYEDEYVYPRIDDISARALWLNLILASVYFMWRRKRLRHIAADTAGIIVLGIFLFIPLWVLRR